MTARFAVQFQMQNLEIWRRLRDIAWLRGLPDAQMNTLSSKCELRSFRKGELITREGETPPAMLIMHSGTATQHRKVSISDAPPQRETPNGGRQSLRL